MGHEASGMCVALDTVTFDKAHTCSHGLAESVRVIATHRDNGSYLR
jgi:hypothetical protein